MACRYVLSGQCRPDASPGERTHRVIAVVHKMVSMMEGVIQVSRGARPAQCAPLLPGPARPVSDLPSSAESVDTRRALKVDKKCQLVFSQFFP